MAGNAVLGLLRVLLSANSAEFVSGVDKAGASAKAFAKQVQTLTTSMDGSRLEKQAAAVAQAIENIGGPIKLTDAEVKKHLVTLNAWIDKAEALGKEIPPHILSTRDALMQVDGAAGKTAGLFGDLTDHVKASALGFLSAQAIIGGVQTGVRALTGFVSESVKAYGDAEAAQRKMTTALQAQGRATPEVVQQYNDLATEFQNTTVNSDDLINEMEALLTQVGGVMPGAMKGALQAASDLSAGLGIDLRAATMMVAKASEENTAALKKAGVQLDETRVKGEGMSYVLGEIQKRFGGQAQAEAETYAGKIKQLGNAWNNFQESVGKTIVENPFVVAALRKMTEGAQEFNAQPEKSAEPWAKWFGIVGAAFDRIIERQKHINEDIATFNKLQADSFRNAPQGPQGAPLALGALDAKGKQAIDDTIAAWKKQDEAAKQHVATLESLFQKFSGGTATKAMADLDTTFRRLADSGKITEDEIRAMVKEALSLSEAGAVLTPRLLAVALATDALSPGLSKTKLNIAEIGQQIQIEIPKLDAFSAALVKMASLPASTLIPKSTSLGINIGIPQIPKMPPATFWQSLFGTPAVLGQQLAQTIVGAFQGGGDAIKSGISQVGSTLMGNLGKSLVGTADKAGPLFNSALGKIFAGAMPVIGSLIGPLVGAIWGKLFGSAGRDAVVDFANSMGGFDALHATLSKELPADAERLWIALTQGVGRNNPAQAKAAIDAITAALAAQKEKTAEAAAAAVDSAKVQQDALDAITAKYAESISAIDSEYKSLSQSVAAEAEEDVMGVVEMQQRARMKDLEEQKKALEAQRDAELASKKETFGDLLTAGIQAHKDLQDIFTRAPLEIAYKFVGQNLPPGAPAISADQLTTGFDSGLMAGSVALSAGAGQRASDTQHTSVLVKLDGRALARGLVRHQPGELAIIGVGR